MHIMTDFEQSIVDVVSADPEKIINRLIDDNDQWQLASVRFGFTYVNCMQKCWPLHHRRSLSKFRIAYMYTYTVYTLTYIASGRTLAVR